MKRRGGGVRCAGPERAGHEDSKNAKDFHSDSLVLKGLKLCTDGNSGVQTSIAALSGPLGAADGAGLIRLMSPRPTNTIVYNARPNAE
jgi:hypothetical protein